LTYFSPRANADLVGGAQSENARDAAQNVSELRDSETHTRTSEAKELVPDSCPTAEAHDILKRGKKGPRAFVEENKVLGWQGDKRSA